MLLAEPLDQASGLRRLFNPAPAFQALGVLGPDPVRSARASLALAHGLARRGGRVLVLDEMPPPRNVGGQIGLLPRPLRLDPRAVDLMDLALPAGEGVGLINIQAGVRDLSSLDERAFIDLADAWGAAAPEWLIVNGAADGLAAMAPRRVLVLPGRKSQLAQAYAVFKTALAAWPDGGWQVLVMDAEPEAALALYRSLAATAERFLAITPGYLGALSGPATKATEHPLIDELASDPSAEALSFAHYWQRAWLYSHASADATLRKVRHAGRP